MANERTILIAEIRARHGRRRQQWNRARVNRLCAILNVTEAVLAAYIDLTPAVFRTQMRANNFHGPVCIALELYEQYAFNTYLGDNRKLNLPFPDKVT